MIWLALFCAFLAVVSFACGFLLAIVWYIDRMTRDDRPGRL